MDIGESARRRWWTRRGTPRRRRRTGSRARSTSSSAVGTRSARVEPRTHLERRTSRLSLRGGSNPREAHVATGVTRGAAREWPGDAGSTRRSAKVVNQRRPSRHPRLSFRFSVSVGSPDAPISTLGRAVNSDCFGGRGSRRVRFRDFRIFALDFRLLYANTRTIERFVKRTKIPKLEPIRSRLPAFPDPTRHEFRLSHRIRRVVRQPLPPHLSSSRRVFFGSRFREGGFTTPRAPRPAYPHAPHLRKSHPTSQWLPLPCLWPLSRPPSSARTSPPSRAPASPRSRPRRWPAAAPPSRYEHRRCARPHRARAADAGRATIARARTHPGARLDRNARASPASSSRRPRARAAAPDRATSRNTRAIAPIQGPARRVRRGYAPGSPRARAEASAGFRRRSPQRAPRSAWRAMRASDARPRARDPAHVRARRALRAPRPALYPLAAVWRRGGTRTRRAEPGFPESRASSAKKRKNVSSLFEHRGFFREAGARPRLEPGSLNPF